VTIAVPAMAKLTWSGKFYAGKYSPSDHSA
jgi:hypothetical protein